MVLRLGFVHSHPWRKERVMDGAPGSVRLREKATADPSALSAALRPVGMTSVVGVGWAEGEFVHSHS